MKELDTIITSATVFRDGARIVRAGKTEVAEGEQIVRIGNITQHAHEDSFRVKGRGHAILRVIDVKRVTKTFEAKGDVLNERGILYFVEDCLEVCHMLSERAITPILFSQPWNRSPNHPFREVSSWAEIRGLVNRNCT